MNQSDQDQPKTPERDPEETEIPGTGKPDDSWQRLSDQMALMKREIDGLQITAMKSARPWFKTPTTIVALLALVFSFGTTTVSLIRAHQQDTQAKRSELRKFIQRLSLLPRENVATAREYADDPFTG